MMKYGLIFQLVLIGLGLSRPSLAIDRFNRSPFNVENLKHEYRADSDCEIKEFQSAQVKFLYVDKDVHVIVNGVETAEQSPIQFLNMGKQNFSTCRSNGIVGYHENELYNDRIVKRIILQRAGFLCSGGRAKSSEEAIYEFIDSKLVVRMIRASYENQIANDLSCSMTRIN